MRETYFKRLYFVSGVLGCLSAVFGLVLCYAAFASPGDSGGFMFICSVILIVFGWVLASACFFAFLHDSETPFDLT